MNERGFSKLYWGFLFIMIDFRIQGFDILPDIIGFILFAIGLGLLSVNSTHFKKAGNLNILMMIISVFSIYQRPNQSGGINFGMQGLLGIIVSITGLILVLLIVYNLFIGIKEMAQKCENRDIYEEADKRWNQFLILQLAAAFAFILILVPPLAIIYIIALLVASIILTVVIMGFMKRCGDFFSSHNVP